MDSRYTQRLHRAARGWGGGRLDHSPPLFVKRGHLPTRCSAKGITMHSLDTITRAHLVPTMLFTRVPPLYLPRTTTLNARSNHVARSGNGVSATIPLSSALLLSCSPVGLQQSPHTRAFHLNPFEVFRSHTPCQEEPPVGNSTQPHRSSLAPVVRRPCLHHLYKFVPHTRLSPAGPV